MRPKALDLCCGAGGVSMGLYRAGYDVVGVDIRPQPHYPFEFHQADALTYPLYGFDFIWASPPCQKHSDLAKRNKNADDWPCHIEALRGRLRYNITYGRGTMYNCEGAGTPYVIENVEGAPLLHPVMLCGTMFPGLRVLRHRLFEASFPILTPAHGKHPKVHTRDKRKAHYGKTDDMRDFVQVTGGGNSSVAAARDAMGIDWMTKDEINEAIPPAYAEHIGRAALAWLPVN